MFRRGLPELHEGRAGQPINAIWLDTQRQDVIGQQCRAASQKRRGQGGLALPCWAEERYCSTVHDHGASMQRRIAKLTEEERGDGTEKHDPNIVLIRARFEKNPHHSALNTNVEGPEGIPPPPSTITLPRNGEVAIGTRCSGAFLRCSNLRPADHLRQRGWPG
jgi:hypothetical protein